jgi:hypothetical protein
MDHEAYDLTAEYVVLKYKADFSPDDPSLFTPHYLIG